MTASRPATIPKLLLTLPLWLLTGCDTQVLTAQPHLAAGRQFLAQGQLDQALLEFNATNPDGDNAEAYYYLALLDERRDNPAAMRRNLQECVRLNPGLAAARLKLAQLEMRAGNPPAALAQVDAVLALHGDDLAAQLIKAQILLDADNLPAAREILDAALDIQPDNSEVLAINSQYFLRSGDLEQAAAAIAAGLRLNPDSPQLHSLKLELDSRRRDVPAMIADYRQLLRLDPERDDLRLRLVPLYLAGNNLPPAAALLRDMIDRHPERVENKLLLLQMLNVQAGQDLPAVFRQWLAADLPPGQLLELARWLLTNGHADLAAATFRQVRAGSGDGHRQALADVGLAEVKFINRNLAAAEAATDAILARDAEFLPANYLKARILLGRNQADATIDLLQGLQWGNDSTGNLYAYLALAYLEKSAWSDAERNFRLALVADPGNLLAFYPIYSNLLRHERRSEARLMLDKALQARPAAELLLSARAELEIGERNWEAARAALTQLSAFSANRAVIRYLHGNILQGTGQYREAIDQYRQVLELTPASQNALANLAVCYQALEERDQAFAFLEGQHMLQPDNMAVISVLGDLYLHTQQPEQTRRLFNGLIARNPQAPVRIYLALAHLENRPGRPAAAARDVLELGLKRNPDDIELLLALGGWHYDQGDGNSARRYFEQAWTRHPETELIVNNLANVLLDSDTGADLDRGREMAQRFRTATNPVYQDTYAWSLVAAAQADRAIPLLKALNARHPDSAELHYHLGMAYLKNAQPEQARAELRRALDSAGQSGREFPGRRKCQQTLRELETRQG